MPAEVFKLTAEVGRPCVLTQKANCLCNAFLGIVSSAWPLLLTGVVQGSAPDDTRGPTAHAVRLLFCALVCLSVIMGNAEANLGLMRIFCARGPSLNEQAPHSETVAALFVVVTISIFYKNKSTSQYDFLDICLDAVLVIQCRSPLCSPQHTSTVRCLFSLMQAGLSCREVWQIR